MKAQVGDRIEKIKGYTLHADAISIGTIARVLEIFPKTNTYKIILEVLPEMSYHIVKKGEQQVINAKYWEVMHTPTRMELLIL